MRRSMVVVLGSIVLTVSMVMVWPVGVETLGPREAVWTGAGTALAYVDMSMETEDGECLISEEVDEPRLYLCLEADGGSGRWYRYWDGSDWAGPLYPHGDVWAFYELADRLDQDMLRFLAFYLGSGFNARYLAAFVLLILTPALHVLDDLALLLLILTLATGSGGIATEEPVPAAPPPVPSPSPSPQAEPVQPAAGPPGSGAQCDVGSYLAIPTVTVRDVGSTATPDLGRAEFWVHEDCSVRMELVWQAGLHEGLCYILVAASTGTSTPRGVVPQKITGRLGGGTTLVDQDCPALDCRGRTEWLFGGKSDVGQLGSLLSSANAKVDGTVDEYGVLDIKPLTFANRFVFGVEEMHAEPQKPPPEGQEVSCP